FPTRRSSDLDRVFAWRPRDRPCLSRRVLAPMRMRMRPVVHDAARGPLVLLEHMPRGPREAREGQRDTSTEGSVMTVPPAGPRMHHLRGRALQLLAQASVLSEVRAAVLDSQVSRGKPG